MLIRKLLCMDKKEATMHEWGAFKSCFGYLANALAFARLLKKSEVLLNAL